MSDEDKKNATTTIASEAIRVLPEADKLMAGRKAGDALTNLAAAAADVTQWIKVVTGLPRGAVGFVAHVAQKFRSVPEERRVLPPPKLLLAAAARYAVEDEDELKARYERLLASAMDSETSSKVHPAFVEIMGEMTGAEARLLDYFAIGGYFESYDFLIAALGFHLDRHRLAVAMRNLERLGLVDKVGPALVKPSAANTPALKHALAQTLGGIHVEEVTDVAVVGDEFFDASTARVRETSRLQLTALGRDFLAVVGKPTSANGGP